jgi:hypothetical protein
VITGDDVIPGDDVITGVTLLAVVTSLIVMTLLSMMRSLVSEVQKLFDHHGVGIICGNLEKVVA